jgi:tetratricopeptide (TPR) repeat protein
MRRYRMLTKHLLSWSILTRAIICGRCHLEKSGAPPADANLLAPHPIVPKPAGWRYAQWTLVATMILLGAVIVAVIANRYGPEASYRRGRQALLVGDRDLALRESKRLMDTVGYEAKGHLLQGLLLARSGKQDEALPWLEKASLSKPLTVEAATVAASCLSSMGRYLETIDAAHAALALDDSCLEARRWLAAAYYDLGATSHAEIELKRLSKDAPRDPRPDRLLGLIAKDAEQYGKAIVHYQETLDRDPRQPDREKILLELAEAQVKEGKFEDALTTLRQCKRSAAALTWMAEADRGLSQLEQASRRLQEAVEIDNAYFPAKLSMGKLLMDEGRVEEAVAVLTAAAELEPSNSQIHFELSQALRRAGSSERADAELGRMREIQVLHRQFTDLHVVAAQEPMNAEARVRLGELAQQLGKPQLAKTWFRAATAIRADQARANAKPKPDLNTPAASNRP